MCFVQDDYDWVARQVDEWQESALAETRCDECRSVIRAGETVHCVHQQEYEEGECQRCDAGDCECDGECCQCVEPDYGETFNYERCVNCDKFLRAVEEAEVEAGCSRSEARPGLQTMCEDIGNGGAHEAKKYARKALQMFPELRSHVAKLWKRMFGR